ncbi:phosphatase PAP2 family protein [Infirmifilum lucidum]|uniref:Phosphatase PAP2 family protein n=1 Tax=Infirmifilum lucidum TaxID=2776706 RepID=A0A7L9FFU3_9CREN|nr:phosphatase PAP2 family protein [Infirmifilum lucidum]QOJ78609.1 phosphatase PAP2 family protein [Infirmifilum lucidum]
MEKQLLVDKVALAATAVLLVSPLLAYLTGLWLPYWKLVTALGYEEAYVALAVVIFVAVSPQLGYYTLLSLLTSAWLNVYLKNALAMPRPPPEQWKVPEEGYGFPSGHAQTSTAFWSAACLAVRRLALAAFSAVLVALISVSRLELGVHYPRDVVGGVLIGLAVSLATYYAAERLLRADKRKASLAVLLYSLLVALLYGVQPDPTIVKVAGVLAGSSAYPLLRDRVKPASSLAWRAALSLLALAIAMALTRAAKAAPPPLQFAAYLAVAVTIISTPLIHRQART